MTIREANFAYCCLPNSVWIKHFQKSGGKYFGGIGPSRGRNSFLGGFGVLDRDDEELEMMPVPGETARLGVGRSMWTWGSWIKGHRTCSDGIEPACLERCVMLAID